jgi:hypothetical protein
MPAALGVDFAIRRWRDVGVALVQWGDGRGATAKAVTLEESGPVEIERLAQHIDALARQIGALAVAIDGPHAWREPDAAARPGVGRAAEYAVRAQAKTGTYDQCFPSTQRRWTHRCIALFDHLLASGRGRLLEAPSADADTASESAGYAVLETYPTQVWRSLGVAPLPAKSRATADDLRIRRAVLLERLAVKCEGELTHDELQAVVAAVVGAGACGAPWAARAHGKAAYTLPASRAAPRHRVEGLIWDLAPLSPSGERDKRRRST